NVNALEEIEQVAHSLRRRFGTQCPGVKLGQTDDRNAKLARILKGTLNDLRVAFHVSRARVGVEQNAPSSILRRLCLRCWRFHSKYLSRSAVSSAQPPADASRPSIAASLETIGSSVTATS